MCVCVWGVCVCVCGWVGVGVNMRYTLHVYIPIQEFVPVEHAQ